MINVIRGVIQSTWRRGIQADGSKGIYHEFKLSGNPWIGTGDESVNARLLTNNILIALAQRQMVLHCNANLKSTADTLFFKYDPNVIPAQTANHFVISLNRNDRLRLINAPQPIIETVKQILSQYWSTRGGIQKERQYHASWEFKLSGTPWWACGDEAVMSRFVMCKILEGLQSQGWHVRAALDMCRRQNDKSVLAFYQSLPKIAPVVCLSFNDECKIRLINAPQEFVGLCRDIIQARWIKGIRDEKALNTPCMAYQFKLFGNPWSGYSIVDGLHIRSMLCFILQMLASRGWKLLISADISAKYVHRDKAPDYPLDVHSWWFTYATEPQQQHIAGGYGFTSSQYGFASPSASGMEFARPPSYEPATESNK
ncbi:uncharacterized protein LOC5501260 isoform X2 [Nematostella vectensis]|nr:uncharacterized protein LOC5501260 isoform X2 [Nematostella vectensis]